MARITIESQFSPDGRFAIYHGDPDDGSEVVRTIPPEQLGLALQRIMKPGDTLQIDNGPLLKLAEEQE